MKEFNCSDAHETVHETEVDSEKKAYRPISLRDNMYINDWLKNLFTGHYPDLVRDVCFESMDVYITTFMQNEDSLLMKTEYEAKDVLFLLIEFPHLDGKMEVELIHILYYRLNLIKEDYQLPVIPCVIFQSDRDYEMLLSLLNQLPFESALLINYLCLVYEK